MSEKANRLLERRNRFIPRGVFNVTSFFAQSARGGIIIDVDGRELIDFSGGIGVVNVGHSHPGVVEAVCRQAQRFTHTCFHVVMYQEYIDLAEKLTTLTPGDFPKMAALFNSGAEAVENAIKSARHYTGKQAVISFDCGFHGRTLLAMTLTGKVKPYKFGFGPFAPEVYHMPYAYCYRCPLNLSYPECDVACARKLEDFFIKNIAAEEVACLIVEPVAGEGGFITPPKEYFSILKNICQKHGIIFIADEIQTGFGRTGKIFAMEHFNVEPDLVTAAKSMGGGLPISALIGRTEIMDHPQIGGMGGTYGGNPVSCAASLAVIKAFEEEDILGKAAELGRKMKTGFDELARRFACVGEVRGLGPMLAMEIVKDRATKIPDQELTRKIIGHAHEKGLITMACGNYGNVIRTLAPLVMDEQTLDKGLEIMGQAFIQAGAT
jgi:4-aminobutyrate aminotransferase / (S)-3-amino-2-methylpropionate transaminase / 5-aminovalerate transaminase